MVMSFRLKTNNDKKHHAWFFNAWLDAVKNEPQPNKKTFNYVFEQVYGYKLGPFAEFVVFPSQEEATMFLLKWS